MNSKKTVLSEVGIGTWALGGEYWGEQKHSDSIKAIHAAIREGFTLFDTAPVYGKGKSEQLLGQQLPNERDNLTISSKCFLKPNNQVEKSFNNSLKRLNTSYIDIFFIHWPSSKRDCRPMVELLEDYRAQGKINHIGLSNFNKRDLDIARSTGKIDIVQNGYNLLWTADQSYFEYCTSLGIKTQSYATIAQGLLTGKFSKENPYKIGSDLRHNNTLFHKNNIQTVYKYLDRLKNIAISEDLSLYELTLAWTIKRPFLDSILVGCRNRKQIEALKSARGKKISSRSADLITELSEQFSKEIIPYNNIFNHFY